VLSDEQLFIQVVHIMTFLDCRADLVRQLSRDDRKECYRLTRKFLATPLLQVAMPRNCHLFFFSSYNSNTTNSSTIKNVEMFMLVLHSKCNNFFLFIVNFSL